MKDRDRRPSEEISSNTPPRAGNPQVSRVRQRWLEILELHPHTSKTALASHFGVSLPTISADYKELTALDAFNRGPEVIYNAPKKQTNKKKADGAPSKTATARHEEIMRMHGTMTQAEIAKTLGVSQSRISTDYKYLEEQGAFDHLPEELKHSFHARKRRAGVNKRRAEVKKMRGTMTQTAIAEKLRVSKATITNDLRAIDEGEENEISPKRRNEHVIVTGDALMKIGTIEKSQDVEPDIETSLWMTTLLPLPFKRALQALRLEEELPLGYFAERAGVSIDTFIKNEHRRPPVLTQILDASVLSEVDFDGKLAQLMFIKNSGRQPMSIADLETCEARELIRYLRIANRGTLESVGDSIGYSPVGISGLELGRNPLNKAFINRFITWLDIPSDSPIADIITTKAFSPGEVLSDSLLRAALSEKYLFVSTRQDALTETQFTTRLRIDRRVGEAIKDIRKAKGLSQTAVANIAGKKQQFIHTIEKGISIPEDYTLVQIGRGLDLSIHDPDHLLWRLVVTAEKQRDLRESTKRKTDKPFIHGKNIQG